MSPAPQITDEQIDQIINQQREGLRNVYRAVLGGQAPWAGVKLLDMPQPHGQQMGVILYIMSEPFAALVTGTMHGFDQMTKTMQRMQGAPAPQPANVPPAAAGNAFGL